MNQHAESLMHWTIAALIAGGIAWAFVLLHAADTTPCTQRECISDIDKRIAAIEAAMLVRTHDRYTGSDAKRDLLVIHQRIDALQRLHQEQHK